VFSFDGNVDVYNWRDALFEFDFSKPFDVEEPFNVTKVYFGSNNLVAVLIIPGQQIFYLTLD